MIIYIFFSDQTIDMLVLLYVLVLGRVHLGIIYTHVVVGDLIWGQHWASPEGSVYAPGILLPI